MKYFKKFVLVLVVAIMTTAMIGCGNKAQQSSEISTETAEAQLQPEGMDKERIQGEGYTIVALEGWHELTEVVVPGYLGLKDDDNHTLTMQIEQGPEYVDAKHLEEEVKQQFVDGNVTIGETETGTVAAGNYLLVEIPKMIITEEDLQTMIDSGQVTQEMVDNAGGKDACLEILSENQVNQTVIYVLYEKGKMFSLTGGYDDASKETIKETMLQTIKSLNIEG